MMAVMAIAGSVAALVPASPAAAATGCRARTGQFQSQVETYLGLAVDGVASRADCVAVRNFQLRHGIRPASGLAGPLTHHVAARLANAAFDQCAPIEGRKICVDLTNQVFWVLDGEERIYGPAPVRTGRAGLATPEGDFHITQKKVSTISTIFHVKMPYWQRFYGAMGFHQTTTYLYASHIPGSHGCINLLPSDAKALFGLTTTGTEVQIFGNKPGT